MDIVRKLTSSLSIPLGWTVLTIVLLCLPGSAFPGGGFFNIPHLDKVIHVILFGGVTIFWCLYFMQKGGTRNWKMIVFAIALSTIALGICMEFVQLNFVANRAFDMGDIAANTLSALVFAAFFFFRK